MAVPPDTKRYPTRVLKLGAGITRHSPYTCLLSYTAGLKKVHKIRDLSWRRSTCRALVLTLSLSRTNAWGRCPDTSLGREKSYSQINTSWEHGVDGGDVAFDETIGFNRF